MLKESIRGCIWVLTGVILFSVVFAIPKFLSQPIPVLQIAFIRYLTGFMSVSLSCSLRKNGDQKATKKKMGENFWLHFLRSILGVMTIICIICASQFIPLANVQILSLTNGLFVLLFSMMFLRERIHFRTLFAAVLCFIGIVIAAEPRCAGTDRWLVKGALLALLSALFWAGEVIVLKLSARRDSASKILLIVNGIACCLLVFPAFLSWTSIGWQQLATLSAMGPLATIAQFCNIKGFQLAEANILVPIRYSSAISSSCVGFIFFGECPAFSTILGGAFIVTGGIIVSLSLLHGPKTV